LGYGSVGQRPHDEEGILDGGEAEGHGSAIDHSIHGIFIGTRAQSDSGYDQEFDDLLESGPESVARSLISYGISDGFFREYRYKDCHHAAQETAEDDDSMFGMGTILVDEEE
jgi:hypothetical protein